MNLNFKKLDVSYEEIDERKGKVYYSPLERGYGRTFGNSIRRILLSSIPGTSIIGVRVSGINHEFQRIPGSANDGTELVSNLKELKFKFEQEGIITFKFKAKKEKTYFAKDIVLPKGVECLTPDVELIKLTGEHEVEIEIFARRGRGYVDGNYHPEFIEEEFHDVIRVDGDFAPIKSVAIGVDGIRVGQDTSFEKLVLTIESDGTLNPKEAVGLASKIMIEHLSFFDDIKEFTEQFDMFEEEKEKENEILDMPIEILELSRRAYNCLKKAKYNKIGDVLSLTEKQLRSLDQLGAKSVTEIMDKLESYGYKLKEE